MGIQLRLSIADSSIIDIICSVLSPSLRMLLHIK